nr:ATP-binding cassette domain-containing protein [Corynebacterium lactis]
MSEPTTDAQATPNAVERQAANPAMAPNTADSADSTGTADSAAIVATNLSLSAEEGPVYGPLTFRVPSQGVTILSGKGGSGRTALALTLAGRMKPDSGSLEVLGHTKLSEIRTRVAIAGVEQVDLLDRDVTVRAVLTEHLNWSKPWWSRARRADEAYLENLAGAVFGPRSLPPLDAYISSIPGLDRHLLRMALALQPAHGQDIEMLVIDDLEQIHELADRNLLLLRVGEIAKDIPVVVNATNPIPEDLIPVAANVELDTDRSHIRPENTGATEVRNRLKKARQAADKMIHDATQKPSASEGPHHERVEQTEQAQAERED